VRGGGKNLGGHYYWKKKGNNRQKRQWKIVSDEIKIEVLGKGRVKVLEGGQKEVKSKGSKIDVWWVVKREVEKAPNSQIIHQMKKRKKRGKGGDAYCMYVWDEDRGEGGKKGGGGGRTVGNDGVSLGVSWKKGTAKGFVPGCPNEKEKLHKGTKNQPQCNGN